MKRIADGRQGWSGAVWPRLLLVLILMGGVGIFLYYGLKPDPRSDEDQVQSIMDDVRAGVATQDGNRIFSHVVQDARISGLTRREARLQIEQVVFRNYTETAVVLKDEHLSIAGDEATLQVHVDFSGTPPRGAEPQTLYRGTVEVVFEKTASRRMLVFPAQEWKVTKVAPTALPEIGGY